MRNLCGFPIPIKFQLTTKHWQQKYMLPQKTAYAGYSESGVITDVLVPKIRISGWSFLPTKSKRTETWQPWVNISHGGGETRRELLQHIHDMWSQGWITILVTRWSPHIFDKIDNYLDLGQGLWGVSDILQVQRLFFLRQRRCILCPCLSLCPRRFACPAWSVRNKQKHTSIRIEYKMQNNYQLLWCWNRNIQW